MLERFRVHGTESRALVDFSAAEVKTVIRALEAHADASLGLLQLCASAEQREEFATLYDASKAAAERLRALGF